MLVFVAPAHAQNAGHSEFTITVDLEAKTVEVNEILRPARAGRITAFVPPNATEITLDGRSVAATSFDGYLQLSLAVQDEALLSYLLPSTTGRAAEGTRVNSAMIGFHLWPNLETTQVQVRLPRGFVANMGSDFVPRLIGDESLEYTLAPIRTDALWGLWFVGFKNSGLDREIISLENVDVEVAAWVDDPEWKEFAVEYVTVGIPRLEEQIGQPWPRGDLRLIESAAPDQAGYGGWYDRRENQIEIPDSLDSGIFLHELAHAWFNDRLFDERWMIEGFAEEYAASAGEAFGQSVERAVEPDTPPVGFQALNEWRTKLWFESSWDVEYYGYTTAHWVVQQIRSEIGDDSMAAAIAGMFDKRHPYAREREGQQVGTNDWRRLLDMLELRGGSTTAEDLFRVHVVTDAQKRTLDTRRETMSRYAELEARSDVDVPESIRMAMSGWRFDDAVRGIGQAEQALTAIVDLGVRAEGLGLVLPSHLVDLYLRAEIDFGRVEAAIAETEQMLTGLEAAPDPIDDDTARLFALGRFNDIEQVQGDSGQNGLNQGEDSGVSYSRYLIAVAGLILALLLISIVWIASMQREQREAREQQRRESRAAPPMDPARRDPGRSDTAIADAAIPDSAIADTAIPGSAIADTAIPGSAIADTAIPGSAIADTAIPGSAIADTARPGSAIADTAMTDTERV